MQPPAFQIRDQLLAGLDAECNVRKLLLSKQYISYLFIHVLYNFGFLTLNGDAVVYNKNKPTLTQVIPYHCQSFVNLKLFIILQVA
jgi:hypothetical protein